MKIVSKVMEKSWKFVGKNVYEPWIYLQHFNQQKFTKIVFSVHSKHFVTKMRLFVVLTLVIYANKHI